MVLFSVQAKLPSQQHVRLLGNHENLGKWSLHDSVELKPSPGDSDCRFDIDNNIRSIRKRLKA